VSGALAPSFSSDAREGAAVIPNHASARTHADSSGPAPASFLDLLRLNDRELDELIRIAGQGTEPEPQRLARRVRLEGQPRVRAELHHSRGFTGRFIVYPLDISAGGMAFLHGTYLHVGTTCIVHFLSARGEPVVVEGTVVRCRHIRGRSHEVGVSFREPFDMGLLVPSSGTGEASTADGGPTADSGAVDVGPIVAELNAIARALDGNPALAGRILKLAGELGRARSDRGRAA
jgi:hypothetical protein